jgi:Raf kinase inhibitor-like YbhB/YbcL family protein
MRHMSHRCARFILKSLSVYLTLTLITLMLAACGGSKEKTTEAPPIPLISLNSTAFKDTGSIPIKYTCSGQNVSPPLSWDTPPQGTQTLAIITFDLDAGWFTHWVLFNLPSDISELKEAISPQGQLPAGALQGKNNFGKIGYGGPCPPSGHPHRYQFSLYAVDQSLDLKTGASSNQVLGAMQGHILAMGQLTGTYQK